MPTKATQIGNMSFGSKKFIILLTTMGGFLKDAAQIWVWSFLCQGQPNPFSTIITVGHN